MQRPKTRFTKAGDVWLAYQVVGEGPVDLVYASGWLHNIDIIWEHPAYRRLLETLASFSRLILFDKRGTGLSDRETGAPTLEERAEDIRAVMDAAGSQRATILGHSEGGHVTAMFAACYPERVRSIILLDCRPCNAWKPDWRRECAGLNSKPLPRIWSRTGASRTIWANRRRVWRAYRRRRSGTREC